MRSISYVASLQLTCYTARERHAIKSLPSPFVPPGLTTIDEFFGKLIVTGDEPI